MILTNNLEEIMKEHRWTIRGLAAATGNKVSVDLILRVRNNEPASLSKLGVLVDFFGLPLVEIVQMKPGQLTKQAEERELR